MFQQIVFGLESGSFYALIGLAIVVIMKSTDVPNFAMAEMGLVVAYLAWFLSAEPDNGGMGWNFWLAIAIALVFSAVFGALTQYLLIRPLVGLSNFPLALTGGIGLGVFSIPFLNDTGLPSFLDWFPVTDGGFPLVVAVILGIAAGILTYLALRHWVKPLPVVDHFPLLLLTIGLTFVLGAAIELIWGAAPQRFDTPWSGDGFEINGTRIAWDQVISILVALAIALAVGGFFRTKWGIRMRAIAEDGATARLLGISVGKVSLVAWAIGTLMAGAAMILSTSSTILGLGSAEGLILKGFIAAVLGGFTSLLGTFVGGLIVGVGEALAGGQIDTSVQPTVALLVVVVVLLVAPGGLTRQKQPREV